jgi:hypothetical protein
MTTYREDIYPARLEACKAMMYVMSKAGAIRPDAMPAILFTWRDLDNRIAAMSHQSLQ